jgi:hypothetical protein
MRRNLSIENVDSRQRKNPFVDSPKNFHIDNARTRIRVTLTEGQLKDRDDEGEEESCEEDRDQEAREEGEEEVTVCIL